MAKLAGEVERDHAFQVGIDIGGTFTDCAVVGDDGTLTSVKALTTHDDVSEGFFSALTMAAERVDLDVADLLGATGRIFHGTTVATNSLLTRRGSKAGVITTRGAGDSLIIMRAHGRVAGRPLEEVIRTSVAVPPKPIVPRRRIKEVDERIDSIGEVVVPLNEDQARAAIEELVDEGVEAIAVCFLWSFLQTAHERRVRELVEEIAPQIHVSCSHELTPKWGEYERLAACAVNAYVGPVVAGYIDRLLDRLSDVGYEGTPLFVECMGGVMSRERASHSALLTIDSGPAAGLRCGTQVPQLLDDANVICTDMGGTSFDVGLIIDGAPLSRSQTVVAQYEFMVPRLDIRSIGAGGGSFISIDPTSGGLRVGPQSAGSMPGPVCFGRGGTQPAVTDADVELGFINPEYFLGGQLTLDRSAVHAAFEPLATRLEMSTLELAAGANRIVDARMADLIREMTIQQGRDPRDFVVLAYGGAGPVHAGAYGRELGCDRIIVPLGQIASVWSALGAAMSDLFETAERTAVQTEPFDIDRLNAETAELEDQLRKSIAKQSAGDETIEIRRFVEARYNGQIHEFRLPVDQYPWTEDSAAALIEQFSAEYERRYGSGAAFREAGMQIVNLRVEATGVLSKPALRRLGEGSVAPSDAARGVPRRIYWDELGEEVETETFWGNRLEAGNVLHGPAVVDLPQTAIVIRPEQTAEFDRVGNLIITLSNSN